MKLPGLDQLVIRSVDQLCHPSDVCGFLRLIPPLDVRGQRICSLRIDKWIQRSGNRREILVTRAAGRG